MAESVVGVPRLVVDVGGDDEDEDVDVTNDLRAQVEEDEVDLGGFLTRGIGMRRSSYTASRMHKGHIGKSDTLATMVPIIVTLLVPFSVAYYSRNHLEGISLIGKNWIVSSGYRVGDFYGFSGFHKQNSVAHDERKISCRKHIYCLFVVQVTDNSLTVTST